MKKVISYSLFGQNPRYCINAIINVMLARDLYPDWEVWIYHDSSVPSSILARLSEFHYVRLFEHPSTDSWKRLMWRFYAYDDPSVKIVIFRDADSYLTKRESDAVSQWISTEKAIHIMREVFPGHNSEIMAGMWGLRRTPKIKSITKLCESYTGHDQYSIDQNFLNSEIYPLFTNDMVVHDANSELRYKDSTHDWPSPIIEDQYIGMIQYPPSVESGRLDIFTKLCEELNFQI